MLGLLSTYASHLSIVHHFGWFREYWDLNYSMPKSLDQSNYHHYCSTVEAVIDGCSEAGFRTHAWLQIQHHYSCYYFHGLHQELECLYAKVVEFRIH